MKHRAVKAAVGLAFLMSTAAPAAQRGGALPVPASATPVETPTVTKGIATSPNYLIGPNDRLRIVVWNQDNVSGEYTVSGDGSFTFPLIGRVVAAGFTVANLEAEVRRLLAAGYFKNPQVTVAVLDYRSKRVFVMGALRQPGAYPLTGEMTLIEALARAGSTTADAADHALIIRPREGGGPVLPGQDPTAAVSRIDLLALNSGQLSAAMPLQDGDTVFVPRAYTVYVYGQVRNPGAYAIGAGTTVRQALSLAGGASEFGAVNRMKVLRAENGKEREIQVEMTDVLKPDDTIVVPERFF